MAGDKRARLKQWLESGEITLQPLTFPQRELWEASPVPVGDMANHICCLIHIRGAIAPEDSRSAIQRVVERQDALRVSFLPGKDRAVQMVRRGGEASFRHAELSGAEATPEGVEARAREVFREPFDLVQGPLYRVEMMKKGADEYVLAFAIHHAIADGWTLGVFVQDLCAAYLQNVRGGGGPLPAVPQTVADWGATERAYWQPAELEKRAAFWKPYLAGSRRIWKSASLPKDAPFALERWVSHVPLELANAARELARRTGTTLFSTLLAAFQATLSRWSGEGDITVGSPVANRNKPPTRETMGYYAGVVPLRGQVSADRPFADGLKALHQTTIDSFANAMPFVELMRAVGDAPAPGHHPLFDVRFALQNHPIPDVDLPGLSARLRMRSTGTARFHLGCELTEMNDGLEAAWLFRPALMPQAELENLDRLYQTFLAAACRSPEGRTGALGA
jgi:hypothetical protein